MVALSSPTGASSGMSMVARALWALLVLSGLTLAYSSPSSKYRSDVSGEEVVIDQLEDFLRSRHHDLPPPPPPPPYHSPPQSLNEKIHFAVTPKDPRYYLPAASQNQRYYLPAASQDQRYYLPPASPPRHKAPSSEDLLRLLPPSDLNSLQAEPEYPSELFQYQDEEDLPPQPPGYQLRQRYPPPPPPPPPPQLLRLPYPGEELYPDPRLGELQDPRLVDGSDDDGGDAGESVNGREESKRVMAEENEVTDDQKVTKEDEEKKAAVIAATSQPEAVNYMHLHRTPAEAREAAYSSHSTARQPHLSDLYFTALVAGCTAVAVCGVVGAGVCWYRLNKSHRAAQDAEYPAYGVTGPNKDLSPSSGDRKLAQSAHMYHYQHQKQQMIALEKSAGGERHGSTSDVDSEEEGEENEYTVYECPGLAPTGEMEVKNPLFHDDPTPATPSMRKEQEEQQAEDEDEEEEEEQKQK